MYHKLFLGIATGFLLLTAFAYPQSGVHLLLDDEFISVDQYGAVGDGVTDDYQAIQDAIDAQKNVVFNSGKTYLVSQPIYLRANSNYKINGNIKIMDGDSSALIVDATVGQDTFIVAEPEKFAVGQWVAVSDTQTILTKMYVRAAWRAFTSKIIEISGDTLVLNASAYPTHDYLVSKNAMVSHCQSIIIAEGIENVRIFGNGTILGNRDNQKQVWPWDFLVKEEKRAGVGICVTSCDNVTIEGLTVRDALLHNISVSAVLDSVFSSNIRLNNITAIHAHDKNIIIKRTNNSWVTNTFCDSATWEDGLIYYLGDSNAVVSNVTLTNNNRSGFCWNSITSQYLTADHITTSGNGYAGVSVNAKYATLSYLTMDDPLSIATYTPYDIVLNNVTITGADGTSPPVVDIGGAKRVTLNNLIMTGCTNDGIRTNGTNEDIIFNGGGIYNHYGRVKSNVTDDITFNDFDGLTEYMYNVGMEIDTLWAGSGTEVGDTLSQSSLIKHSGTYSKYISTNSFGEGVLSPLVYLDSNRVYNISFWIYPLVADSSIKIVDLLNRWQIDTTLSLTLNQWNEINLTVSATVTDYDELLIKAGGGSGTPSTRFYLDDVSVIAGVTYSGSELITATIDRGLEPVSVYQSDFSVDANGWTNYTTIPLAGNIDGIWGEDNVLRGIPNSTSSGGRFYYNNFFTVGTKYAFSFRYLIPAANNTCDNMSLYQGNMVEPALITFFNSATNVWSLQKVSFVSLYDEAMFSVACVTATTDSSYYKDMGLSTISNYTATGNHSIDTSSTYKQAGSYSGKIIATAAGNGTTNTISLASTKFTAVTSGLDYRFKLYAYTTTANTTLTFKLGDITKTAIVPTSGMSVINFDFVATASTTGNILLYLDKAATVYTDELSLKSGQ